MPPAVCAASLHPNKTPTTPRLNNELGTPLSSQGLHPFPASSLRNTMEAIRKGLNLMNGLLVRVGIDSTDGGWNAPIRLASGDFAYVAITDTKPLRDGMARRYDEFIPVAKRFGEQLPTPL